MAKQEDIFQLIDNNDKASLDKIREHLKAHPQEATKEDRDGRLPLHMAIQWNLHPNIVEFILKTHPGAAAKKDKDGRLPLHFATQWNSELYIVELILNAYPQAVFQKDKSRTIMWLLDSSSRADINIFGKTPIDFAKQHYCEKDVIEVLEAALDKFMDRVPKEFICPITSDIMNDPVMAEDGNTYERAAIVQWFEDHNTSPLTNVVLESKKVILNRALKSLIDSYIGN